MEMALRMGLSSWLTDSILDWGDYKTIRWEGIAGDVEMKEGNVRLIYTCVEGMTN